MSLAADKAEMGKAQPEGIVSKFWWRSRELEDFGVRTGMAVLSKVCLLLFNTKRMEQQQWRYIYIYNIILFVYIYAQNPCLAVGWNCLKLGVCHDFWKFPMEKCCKTPSAHTSASFYIFLFLCFTTSCASRHLPTHQHLSISFFSCASREESQERNITDVLT